MTVHSVEQHFMDIASERLPPATFALILAAAQEMCAPGQAHIPVPKRHRVEKPFLQERIAQSFVILPADKPRELQEGSHVAMRLEERMQLAVSPSELGELKQLIKRGQMRTLRKQLQTIVHCEVHWRGKVFVAIFNQSRDELITAYEFKPARPPTHKGVRFPAEKARKRLGVRDIYGDDDDE